MRVTEEEDQRGKVAGLSWTVLREHHRHESLGLQQDWLPQVNLHTATLSRRGGRAHGPGHGCSSRAFLPSSYRACVSVSDSSEPQLGHTPASKWDPGPPLPWHQGISIIHRTEVELHLVGWSQDGTRRLEGQHPEPALSYLTRPAWGCSYTERQSQGPHQTHNAHSVSEEFSLIRTDVILWLSCKFYRFSYSCIWRIPVNRRKERSTVL